MQQYTPELSSTLPVLFPKAIDGQLYFSSYCWIKMLRTKSEHRCFPMSYYIAAATKFHLDLTHTQKEEKEKKENP